MPVSVLRAAPFSHVWGDSISATVRASNIEGDSAVSLSGNGAIIITYPDAPVSLANDESTTSAYLIGITWEDGLADGGNAITGYRISYAENANTLVWAVIAETTSRNYATSILT